MESSDQKLIKDYLEGDESAFKTLLDRYLKSVYGFIYRICKNKEDAEDAVQEAFFKAWKNLKKYRGEENPDALSGASFKTWLFTIARNTAIDLLRKKKSFVFSDFENEDGGNNLGDRLVDPEPMPDQIFILAENKKILDDLLSKLSPIYKQVLLLKYENDFTFEEIGKILDKPLNTVKSQHRRALIVLHQNIDVVRINE